MGQDSIGSECRSSVLWQLERLLEAHRSAFGQERVFERVRAMVLAEVMTFTRHTVTQMLLTLGLTEPDWSAWYRLFSRKRYDAEVLDRCLLRETLPHVGEDEAYVLGIDAMQVPRTSMSMPGTGWAPCPQTPVFHRGIHRAQRFEHGAWLVRGEDGYSRAVPLRFMPLLSAKSVALEGRERCTEWQGGLEVAQWARRELDGAGRGKQQLVVIGDGAYDTIGLWRGMPERTVVMVRTKVNRKLYELPGAYGGRGRRRKYGPQAPTPGEWVGEKEGWAQGTVGVRGRTIKVRYRVEGPYLREQVAERGLYLLVVGGASWSRGNKEVRRRASYYLVSGQRNAEGGWQLPYKAAQLLEWLWQRWELEVAHREMKAGLGLGDKQCWNRRSAETSVRWSAWVYGMAMLAGYRAWGLVGGRRPPGRWWHGSGRWSISALWQQLRAELWGERAFTPLWPGRGNWAEKQVRIGGMANAVAGASRI